MSSAWKKLKVGDLISYLESGVSVNSTEEKPLDGSLCVLKVSAVTYGKFNPNAAKTITEAEIPRAKCNPKKGHIIISRSNTPDLVGASAFVDKDYPNRFLPDKLWQVILNKKHPVNSKWLFYYLSSPRVRYQLSKLATGSSNSMKNITKDELLSLSIMLPTLPEQNNIVFILDHIEAIIDKTEALIKAKEKQFVWLIDNLIIKATNNHWNLKKLSNLSKIKKGQQLNRILLTKTDLFPAWNGGITPSGYTDTWNTPKGTVTISEGGNSCGFVNYCKEKFWCGGHCYALLDINHEIESEFLFYFLKAHEKQIMSLRVGSGLPNIQRRDIEKLEIAYPQLSEQRKIVRILSEAQKEISMLNLLMDKYIHQKRGLMQKLLTGEWQIMKLQEEVA